MSSHTPYYLQITLLFNFSVERMRVCYSPSNITQSQVGRELGVASVPPPPYPPLPPKKKNTVELIQTPSLPIFRPNTPIQQAPPPEEKKNYHYKVHVRTNVEVDESRG